MLWKPLPGFQTKALQCAADEALYGGAAGPGKTDALLMGALRDIHEPWCKVWFLRRSYPELQEVMDRSHGYFPRLGGTWSAQEKRWHWPSGGTYRFLYCSSYKEALQYWGQDCTHLAFDDAGLLPEERIWTALMSRLRSADPRARGRLLARLSANPGGPGHAWLKARLVESTGRGKRLYRDARGLTRAFVPGRLDENPYLGEEYRSRLMLLPEQLRRAILDGDWDAATGLAFGELDETVHWVDGRVPPAWWMQWGGYDWGFAHWAVFCWFAKEEASTAHPTGRIHVVDTVWMLRRWPDQQAEEVWERVPVKRLRVVYGGADCWDVERAKGPTAQVVADEFVKAKIPLIRGNTDPRVGYTVSSEAVAFRGRGPDGSNSEPQVVFHRTPGNRRLFDQLAALVLDPDDPRKVLKVNADPMTGEGGDDGYDAFRHGLTAYIRPKEDPAKKAPVHAWDPAVLEAEAEQKARGAPAATPAQVRVTLDHGWEADG